MTDRRHGFKHVYTPTGSIVQSDKGLRPKSLRRNGEAHEYQRPATCLFDARKWEIFSLIFGVSLPTEAAELLGVYFFERTGADINFKTGKFALCAADEESTTCKVARV